MFETIKKYLSDNIPFAKHASIDIQEVGAGIAQATLPERPELQNHIGSQHAGALYTLGETTSGAAMAGAFGAVLFEVRPVAAEANIKYVKVAKGPILAKASVDSDAETLLATLEDAGKVRFMVQVSMTDAAGDEVATMSIQWYVSKRR